MTESSSKAKHIAYVVSRFPKLSETFIRREMAGLERLGWHVSIFPFIRENEAVSHPSVTHWLNCLTKPRSPFAILAANLAWLRRKPSLLLSLYILVLRELWRYPGDLARGFLAVAYAAAWAREVRERGIVHVHAHFALHPAVAALAIKRLAGISFSFTGHSYDLYQRQAMLAVKVREASFVVVISRLLRDRFVAPRLSAPDLEKVRIIRCGVDRGVYQLRPNRDQLGTPTILAVARLAKKKGLQDLIDAGGMLRERGIDVECRIAGDGPLRLELQERIDSARLGKVVTLLGAQTEAGILGELNQAAVFVLPSVRTPDGDMEGVPVSLMEAMAVGVPVIATRTGAISELVENGSNGLLVDPGDAAALARAIERMLSDSILTSRLVTCARQKIEAEFDLDRNVAMLDRLLRAAVRSPIVFK